MVSNCKTKNNNNSTMSSDMGSVQFLVEKLKQKMITVTNLEISQVITGDSRQTMQQCMKRNVRSGDTL